MALSEPSAAVELHKCPTFLIEIWTLYGFGTLFIFLRWAVRLRTVGLRGFQWDDYLNGIYLLLYTSLVITYDVVFYTGSNLDTNDIESTELDDHDVYVLGIGSRLQFSTMYTGPASIWVLKFMVLFFYRRLTTRLAKQRTINILFWACGLSFIAVFLTVSLSCRKFEHNWQVDPHPERHCVFRPQDFWVTMFLNVFTDAALLIIPIPILRRLQVPWPKKVAVSVLLGSGGFVIASSIVRAVMTLSEQTPTGININRWGFRESTIGVIAVTVPILSPMATKRFWRRGPYTADESPNDRQEKSRQVLSCSTVERGRPRGWSDVRPNNGIRGCQDDIEAQRAREEPPECEKRESTSETSRDGASGSEADEKHLIRDRL